MYCIILHMRKTNISIMFYPVPSRNLLAWSERWNEGWSEGGMEEGMEWSVGGEMHLETGLLHTRAYMYDHSKQDNLDLNGSRVTHVLLLISS